MKRFDKKYDEHFWYDENMEETPRSKPAYFLIYVAIFVVSTVFGFFLWGWVADRGDKSIFQNVAVNSIPVDTVPYTNHAVSPSPRDKEERLITQPVREEVKKEQEAKRPIEQKSQEEVEQERQKALEQQQKKDLATALERANRAFNATPSNENEAFIQYKKAVELDPNDFTGYNAFMQRAKSIYEVLEVYDARIKGLLLKAQELQNTEEVRNELAKCQ